MIRVLVADGSPIDRAKLIAVLKMDPDIVVVGEATRATEAKDGTKRLRPELVILAARLPGGGGLGATKEIMVETPTPVIIVSDASDADQVITSMEALRAGALTVLPRPRMPLKDGDNQEATRFVLTVKAMAQVHVVRQWREKPAPVRTPISLIQPSGTRFQAIAIAASTGGPGALERILRELPSSFSVPILIVQHISKGFLGGMIDWLNTACALTVKIAESGEPIAGGTVYVAPDNFHLGVSGGGRILLSNVEQIGGFRPSASFLFESVAKVFGKGSLHVILTGMGRDGVTGLEVARAAGATVIAQDEGSSVVYGMNRMAVEAGFVDHVVDLDSVSRSLIALTSAS